MRNWQADYTDAMCAHGTLEDEIDNLRDSLVEQSNRIEELEAEVELLEEKLALERARDE